MRGIAYNATSRHNFAEQIKQLPQQLLLKHETTLLNSGAHYSVFDTPVSGEKPWAIPSKNYITGNEQEEFSHGYNTYHDAKMRGEIPDG